MRNANFEGEKRREFIFLTLFLVEEEPIDVT